MSLGTDIAMGPIRRSGTGAATQTHISAGSNQDVQIQLRETSTKNISEGGSAAFVRQHVAWVTAKVTSKPK